MHAQAKHANSMLEELWLELKPRTLLLRGNRTNNHQADSENVSSTNMSCSSQPRCDALDVAVFNCWYFTI